MRRIIIIGVDSGGFDVVYDSLCSERNDRHIQEEAKADCRGRPCSSSLTGGKPHFFKITISSIQCKQLRIPPKFAKKYGEHLSKTESLTVPNGAAWKVEVVKSDDVIRLSSGWEKFMESYSIKLGHFLVFRYEGNSSFYVLIFGMSATETKYPTLVRKVDSEIDCNVGAIKEVGAPMKMLEESPSKKISGVKFLVPKSEETEADVGLPIPRMGVKHKAKESVLLKAEAFQSRSPCFMVIMPKSSVSDSHPLRIPTSYGRKYILKEHSKSITLQVDGNKKRWTTNYSFWNCGSVVTGRFLSDYSTSRLILHQKKQDHHLLALELTAFTSTETHKITFFVINKPCVFPSPTFDAATENHGKKQQQEVIVIIEVKAVRAELLRSFTSSR
ncbi:B3 domain-containing transcription factor VRN1-like protein [Drosera capensis]